MQPPPPGRGKKRSNGFEEPDLSREPKRHEFEMRMPIVLTGFIFPGGISNMSYAALMQSLYCICHTLVARSLSFFSSLRVTSCSACSAFNTSSFSAKQSNGTWLIPHRYRAIRSIGYAASSSSRGTSNGNLNPLSSARESFTALYRKNKQINPHEQLKTRRL